MDKLFVALLVVLCLSIFKGGVVHAVTAGVYIHPPGPKHFSSLGSTLTLSCILSGQVNSRSEYILKWLSNTAVVFQCTETGLKGALLYDKGCNLTIHPVEVSSEGVYTCDLLDLEGSKIRDSVELYVIDPLLNSTADLLDLSTGDTVDLSSGPFCLPSNRVQAFECTVRDTKPGIWNITWIIGNTPEEGSLTRETISTRGLVNVSSRFTLPALTEDDFPMTLTCWATILDRVSLNVSVQLKRCVGLLLNSTMDLVDLSTGAEVDQKSVPICIQQDTERTFECTVRNTSPNGWIITWIIDNSKINAGAADMTPIADGLVNISSRITVSNSQKQGAAKSLTCLATSFKTGSLAVTVEFQFCSGLVSNASMDLLDLSTGTLVDSHSRPICFRNGADRTFECTVRQTIPDTWNMVWVINNTKVESRPMVQIPDKDELVNVFSRFTVANMQDESFLKSLTCRAFGLNKELSATVQLQPCSANDPDNTPNTNTTTLVAVISVSGSVLTIAVVALVIFAVRAKRNHNAGPTTQTVLNLEEPVEKEALAKKVESYAAIPQDEVAYQKSILPQNAMLDEDKDAGLPSWAEGLGILWSDLIVDERILGSGNFGEVRSGTVRIGGELTKSAIKMLKGYASRSDRDDFMDEFYTMASIGYHPNIVFLLGACQHQDVLYVALEYLPHGDLRSYLRTARSQSDSDEDALSSDQLVKFALDVAKGMEHLSRAGVIHRDLAARNILVGEGLVAKVSDFGLSRGEDIYVQTSRRRVPLRWLAIESVKHQMYTTKSDVWSFGILLWEIATFGGTPYPSIQNEMLAATLKRGYRMPKPDNCHDQIYALMRLCWDEDPNSRPTFSDLVLILSDMADNRIKHTYMSHHYQNMSVIRPELDDD